MIERKCYFWFWVDELFWGKVELLISYYLAIFFLDSLCPFLRGLGFFYAYSLKGWNSGFDASSWDDFYISSFWCLFFFFAFFLLVNFVAMEGT